MAPGFATFGLVLARPLGLAGLALVVVAYLLARRGGSGPLVWSSTAELWSGSSSEERPSPARRRLSWPVRLWLLAALAACLALAGPGASGPGAGRTWTVLVDRRPAMHLALSADSNRTRLDSALELASAVLADVRAPGDRVLWRSWSDAGLEEAWGEPPAEWLEPPASPAPAPDWFALDREGVLFVSDALPPGAGQRAGLALAGGEAVPGSVARIPGGDVRFDGSGLGAAPAAGPPLRARALDGVPAPVRRALEAWALARGLELVVAGPCELELGAAGSETPVPAGVAGHEGWTWALASARGEPRGEPWLTGSGGAALVAWRPGRVELVRGFVGEPMGDPAAFAVSWARLFDAALLRPLALAGVADRRARGAARRREPLPPRAVSRAPGERALPWDSLLALLAAGLALVGTWLARGARPAPQAALSPSSTSP